MWSILCQIKTAVKNIVIMYLRAMNDWMAALSSHSFSNMLEFLDLCTIRWYSSNPCTWVEMSLFFWIKLFSYLYIHKKRLVFRYLKSTLACVCPFDFTTSSFRMSNTVFSSILCRDISMVIREIASKSLQMTVVWLSILLIYSHGWIFCHGHLEWHHSSQRMTHLSWH